MTKHWGVPTSGDNIIVSTGAVTAIAAAFASLINPGDEVLLPSPAWPNYASAATLLGATVGTYPMPASSGWLPTAEGLRSSITSNTKAVVLNNPSNPTGRLMPPQLVADMLDVCHEVCCASWPAPSQPLASHCTHLPSPVAARLACMWLQMKSMATWCLMSPGLLAAVFRMCWCCLLLVASHLCSYPCECQVLCRRL